MRKNGDWLMIGLGDWTYWTPTTRRNDPETSPQEIEDLVSNKI